MKEIKTVENQTVYDVAVMYYGTCEAVSEIIRNNPELGNDARAKTALGIDAVSDAAFYPDLPIRQGSIIRIDTDSRLIRKNALREIEKEVTTFNVESYGTHD